MSKKQFLDAAKNGSAQEELPIDNGKLAPSRVGMKHVGGHYPPEVARQLRIIAAEEGSSIQELLKEGINAVFEARGHEPLQG